MSGHFAFWCHISTTLTFSSTPPFVGRIIKQPEGLIHEQPAKRAYCPEGAPRARAQQTPRDEVPSLMAKQLQQLYIRAGVIYGRSPYMGRTGKVPSIIKEQERSPAQYIWAQPIYIPTRGGGHLYIRGKKLSISYEVTNCYLVQEQRPLILRRGNKLLPRIEQTSVYFNNEVTICYLVGVIDLTLIIEVADLTLIIEVADLTLIIEVADLTLHLASPGEQKPGPH